MTKRARKPRETERPEEYWSDWLLDAVACATQDRRFLRGDDAYDEVLGEAVLANGKKAITNALAWQRQGGGR